MTDAFEIRSTLTLEDWRAYQAAWALRLQQRSRLSRATLLGMALMALTAAAVLVMLASHLQQQVPFLAVVIGACAAIGAVMMNMRRVRAASQPNEPGVILGPGQLRFDADGMHLTKAWTQVHHRWATFQEITQGPAHLFVWIDRVAALIVPIRDLPAGITPGVAATRIMAFATEAPQSMAPSADLHAKVETANALPAFEPPRVFDASTSFPRAIFRFLTLRTAVQPALELSDRALLALAAASLALWLVFDRLTAGPDSIFYLYGALAAGWYAALIAATAALWARLSQPQVPLRNTLALALAFVPIATLIAILCLWHIPASAMIGALVLLAFYASAYAHAGLRSLTGQPQPLALIAGLATLSLAAWFAYTQYVSPQFWYADEDAVAEDEVSLSEHWQQFEPLLFAQADRIDQLVAGMDRPEGLDAAGFFIGFAGMGEERVFASEIALARDAIARAFDTGPRSLQLVNDRRDIAAHPFASLSALRRALHRVSEKMDPERDVLFLAISSHGAENGDLAVSNPGIVLNDMSTEDLADALDEAGIVWRVVIVSACYSGQFIEPLRNDRTIVITAAAADRTSFGCSDQRELTYFGEAFYRDALPDAADLRAAFQQAKAAVARREKEEKIEEPSNPQAHFGRAIERHLQRLEVASD